MAYYTFVYPQLRSIYLDVRRNGESYLGNRKGQPVGCFPSDPADTFPDGMAASFIHNLAKETR